MSDDGRRPREDSEPDRKRTAPGAGLGARGRPAARTRFTSPRREVSGGLEGQAKIVIGLLQLHGSLTFQQLMSLSGLDHRRLYDVLNALVTTPLVSKSGSKRDACPFVWADGKPLPEVVDMRQLPFLIEAEQQACLEILASLYALNGLIGPTAERPPV